MKIINDTSFAPLSSWRGNLPAGRQDDLDRIFLKKQILSPSQTRLQNDQHQKPQTAKLVNKKLVIFLFTFLVLTLVFAQTVWAQSGSVSISPSSGSFTKDATFEVEVKINVSEAVTAAKIYINFDNGKLSGQNVDVSGSAFTTTWPEAAIDNSSGLVKLQAAQSNPGVSGDLSFAKLTFKATAEGSASLNLDSSSLLLTSDDRNLLTSFGSMATFTITAPASSGGGSSGGGGGGGSSSGGGGGGGSSSSSSSAGACAKRGDVDCNGSVNIVDLSRLLANWRKNFKSADFNNSGVVDIVDLSILLSNWKK